MGTKLTADQFEQWHQAIVDGYRFSSLETMVQLKLGKDLYQDISPPNQTFDKAVVNLISWAQQVDRQGDLIRAAHARNDSNKLIQKALADYEASDSFEKIVRPKDPSWFVDGDTWRRKWEQTEWAVCRVEFQNEALGTGFLIGTDLVITNHHVVFDRDAGSFLPHSEVGFHFGYRVLKGDEIEGVRCRAVEAHPNSADPWPVCFSESGQLDFAVVRLNRKVGDEKVGNYQDASKRGWLTPEAKTFHGGETLAIIQHPKGAPLKTAFGSYLSTDGFRVCYDVNTDNGSSGSPVILNDWSVAALHNKAGHNEQNCGILFRDILPSLPAGVITGN